MDPSKTSAVLDWLLCFLGFANFYRNLYKLLQKIHPQLQFSGLTSPCPHIKNPFQWNSSVEQAFLRLKTLFATAPILRFPDVNKQFIVEVDASNTGIGAILCQRSDDNKMHPCSFYSKSLSPAERNYDVGDCELLAVKMTLEEWRQ